MGLKHHILKRSFTSRFSNLVISRIFRENKLKSVLLFSMGSNKVCSVCQSPAEKVCSACHSVIYCSSEHQKMDWKNHKRNCLTYIIEKNDALGRYVVAVRNLLKGSIILTEEPLVIGPKMYSPPVCLGCHRRVDGSYFCSRCGYPMCSKECQEASIHKDNECRIFEKKGSSPKKISDFESLNPLYQSILPLRCLLLREKSPAKWEQLNTLEHHLELRKVSSEVWNEQQVNIVQFLLKWYNLQEDFTEDDINRVIGFLEVNSFQIKTVKNIEICGLFKMGAMMSHDCVANTHHAFAEDGRMILRASIDIKKGDLITACYVDALAGTIERRQTLEKTKYFSCACARCQDPTEFGAYISALKCTGCKEGYLLPENPLDSKSSWICFDPNAHKPNIHCKVKFAIETVNTKIAEIKASLEQALPDETSIEALERAIASNEKLLHSNHYLIIPLRQQLHKLYQGEVGRTKDLNILERNKRMILKLFSVLDVLDVGYSRARGILLHEQYKLDNQIAKLQLENGAISTEEYDQEVQNSVKVKKELEKIFELDLLIGVKR